MIYFCKFKKPIKLATRNEYLGILGAAQTRHMGLNCNENLGVTKFQIPFKDSTCLVLESRENRIRTTSMSCCFRTPECKYVKSCKK